MSGRELYQLLQAIWQRPASSEWGVVADPWDSLGPRRRLLWDQCAVAVFAELRTVAPSPVPTGGLDGTLEQISNQVIADRMKQFNGDRKQVAKSLGISLKGLYLKYPVESRRD